jgi:hypothetical protein
MLYIYKFIITFISEIYMRVGVCRFMENFYEKYAYVKLSLNKWICKHIES